VFKKYIKFSILFYIFLCCTLYFGYSEWGQSIDKIKLMTVSFLIFGIAHFALTIFLSSMLSFAKKSFHSLLLTLFVILVFLASLFCYSIIVGYQIGIANWAAPLDHNLYKDIIARPFSFIGLIFLEENYMLILLIIIVLCLSSFIYYWLHRKELVNIAERIATYSIAGKSIGLATIVIPILLIYSSPYMGRTLFKSGIKKEIFISFFNPIDNAYKIDKIGSYKEFAVDKVDDFDKKNVILISVECLRADHISFNGYHRKTTPFLDSLYEAGSVVDFEVSTSTCASTLCGLLSSLNSCDFSNMGYFKFGIHDYLKKQGYKINFLLGGLHESWHNLKKHYGDNIDLYKESKHYSDYNINDDHFLEAAIDDVETYDGTPNFFFLHLMSPHPAGYKKSTFRKFQPTIANSLITKTRTQSYASKDVTTLYTNNYDNGILQADHVIKEFLEALETKGFMDNALVVIMGDHGEALTEHDGFLGHNLGLWQEYIGIPILFIDNDASFYKEKKYATQIDIAPTIVDRLGLPGMEHWQGKSLKNKVKKRKTYHETTVKLGTHVLASVSQDGDKLHKYIYKPDTGEQFYYDLVKDPLEKTNLIVSLKDAEGYKKELIKYKGLKDDEIKNRKTYTPKLSSTQITKIRNSAFLSKELIKDALKLDVDLLRNCDIKTKNIIAQCHFTWNENQKYSNSMAVTISPEKKKTNLVIQELLEEGIKGRLKYLEASKHNIDGQIFILDNENNHLVTFHNNKRIQISSYRKSKFINRKTLVALAKSIQNKLN